MLEKENSKEYQKLLKEVLADFDKTKEEIAPIVQKELIRLVIKRILIKDKKIVKLELHQPFERYLKELKCNINQIIATVSENSYLSRPMVGRWVQYCTSIVEFLEMINKK